MVSILISNKILTRILRPTNSTSEVIIGSIGKCLYETLLLQSELKMYAYVSIAVCPRLLSTIIDDNATAFVFGMTPAFVMIGLMPFIPVIPLIRTGFSLYKKKIHIVSV